MRLTLSFELERVCDEHGHERRRRGGFRRGFRLFTISLMAFNLSACQQAQPVAEWSIEPPPAGQKAAVQKAAGSGKAVGVDKAVIVEGSDRMIGRVAGERGKTTVGVEDGVNLNLVNLPIAEAAKIVLADMAGVDYVIDPRLDGKVTVHTSHPVTRAAALDLFQASLRVAGAALVNSGGVYKILPAEAAGAAGGDIVAAGPAQHDAGIGGGSVVVPLRFVSASEIKRVLDPIAARGGAVRADDGRHAVILSGSPQEVSALRDAISIFDVDTMRGMSFALIPVKSGDPTAIADNLRNVFGTEKDGPMNGMIRFVGNKNLSSILVISSQRGYLERARIWIEKFDSHAEGTEKQFFTYRVQNRPAKELLRVLLAMFVSDSGGKASASVSPRQEQVSASTPTFSGQNGNPPANPIGGINGSGAMSQPGQEAPKTSGAAAGAVEEAVAAGLSDDGRYRLAADEAKNALVIMATPNDYRKILRVIQTLDVLPNQVFIEATIAEVSLNDNLQFGVQWFLQKGKSAAALSNTQNTPTPYNDSLGSNLLGAGVGAAFPGFAYALRTGSAQVTLNALMAVTSLNIVSTPSLTVSDNHLAVLQVGDQVPVTSLQSATALGNTFTSVTYKDTGVILSITPHISESGRVILNLVQEVSNVAPDSTPGSTTPTIQQRKVETQVVINDGDALMLGGLMQNSRTNTNNQIPVLGELPLVGSAFKSKTDISGKTELLIMITPHVVRSVSEAREITEEYKRQVLSISGRAIKGPSNPRQTLDRALLGP